jgi:hypothetical protein
MAYCFHRSGISVDMTGFEPHRPELLGCLPMRMAVETEAVMPFDAQVNAIAGISHRRAIARDNVSRTGREAVGRTEGSIRQRCSPSP